VNTRTPRRRFIRQTAAACAFSILPSKSLLRAAEAANATSFDFPLVDFHTHLDNSTIDKVCALSAERRIKLGIVEHAGTKENKYPVMLSNDDELKAYIRMLAGKPVFKGVQAEWIDWRKCFSADALGQLDYALGDAMTMPRKNGERMKLWEKDAEIGAAEAFMDKYVEWHVEVMATQPIDIFGNTTWTPESLMPDYDKLWTPKRMETVIAAAVKQGIALEISSSYKLPRLPFLRRAKEAGVKFSFGSNGRYPKMGLLDYSVEMGKELGLTRKDMFVPNGPRSSRREEAHSKIRDALT
jgi:histidinol phosphatase-like PHP family hydrolase